MIDMDSFDFTNPLPGGTGMMVPQTDNATASFNGNYIAGWQNFTSDLEFDMISQGSMTADGTLSLTGMVSDPFFTQSTPDPTSTTDTFSGDPKADTKRVGRYTMLSGSHLLTGNIDGTSGLGFTMVLYQASGAELFWMDYDNVNYSAAAVGPLEQLGSLAGVPAASKPKGRSGVKHKP